MSNLNFKNTVDTTIRLILLMLLIAWCLTILMPFLSPVIWGLIIAVSLAPLHVRLTKKLKGKNKLSAILITLVLLAILIIPAALFTNSMVDGAKEVGALITNEEVKIPPPNEKVKEWPLIGSSTYDLWSQASRNLESVIKKYSDEIAGAGQWLVHTLVGTGLSVIMIFLSIIISGVFLMNSEAGDKLASNLSKKLMGDRGLEIGKMAESTIRNVTKGVLGVAFIQSFAAGLGFVLAGVPYAGLWAIICLFLAIIQVGPGLVIIPVIAYLWSSMGGVGATLWTIYFIVVMLGDNVIKPILLGKGAPVPMLVIFLGAIGGFMATGFLGLFTGAVVLSLGYKLFLIWINGEKENTSVDTES